MNRTHRMIVGGLLLAAVAVAFGYFLGQRATQAPVDAPVASSQQPDERPVLYWYDPMVPEQRFERPGKSPFMDMMLVPRYADEQAEDGVSISAALQQNLGVRTATVTRESIARPLRVPGTLQWDPTGEVRVTARVEGQVEQVHVRIPFALVKRGDALATVLAPDLAAAIGEYRALLRGSSEEAQQLQRAARHRLQLLGLSPRDVSGTDGSPRIVLRAPATGVLAEVAVREGDTVAPGQLLFQINAIDPIWIQARVPQGSADQLVVGERAKIWVGAGAAPLTGTLDAVLPDVDPVTRTQSVRVVVPNPDGRLAAGAFAEIELATPDDAMRVWIPSEALIQTGRESRVIVKRPDESFQPVQVSVGRQVDERTEIIAGLVGGEEIVLSGQFLIDSEASLSGVLSRLETVVDASDSPAAHAAHAPAPRQGNERRVLYWYDPMVPEKRFDRPGKSPFMDMQLVPKYADEVPRPQPQVHEDGHGETP